MAQNIELLGSYWTLAGGAIPHTDKDYSPFDFKDRVEAAAKAGFKGIGIWHTDLAHILKTRSLKEMRQILDYNGIKHFELEFLTGWFLDGEAKKESDQWKKLLFTAAETLGARHVKVGHFVKEPVAMPRLIESFAGLCAEAANHGTKILFELMPFGMIDTLTDTMTMIKGAGAKNGGVIFDLWHLVKLGIPYDDVARVVGQCEVGVELNDGTFQCPWDLHEDTINHRRLCGEGEFDVKGFVKKMLQAGYSGPWGIEVLNAELRQRPLEELVTRSFNTTMAQFPK
ncbi:MAG: sugar phosphate isomerase/epimerase [Acidobacteriia bacterium]|nr:sugar phosphate isomerase/epimerase [Terriglobia bacterium]